MSVSHIRRVETALFVPKVIALVSTTGRSEDTRGGVVQPVVTVRITMTQPSAVKLHWRP